MRGLWEGKRAIWLLVLLGGCSDAAPFVADSGPVDPPSAGESLELTGLVDQFDGWNRRKWTPESHPMGRGRIAAENVRLGDGALELTLPGGAFDGSEIISSTRLRHRPVEARLRVPDAPGSISAFFLYEGVRGGNDEIDIEILNDDSKTVWFTVWVAGEQVHHERHVLGFDPRTDFHDYRIEWSSNAVRFLVDGNPLAEFSGELPSQPLYLMSNAWWPTWIDASPSADASSLAIDRIIY